MKESAFIELLNLYIDQQISPEDAAQLEEEIQIDARRRRIYQQYCRMHRACTIVLENYRTPAEVEPAIEFRPRARRVIWGYAAAGLAAACVALVAVRLHWRPARVAAPSAPAAKPLAVAAAGNDASGAVPVRLNVAAPAAHRLGNDPVLAQALLVKVPAYGRSAFSLVSLSTSPASAPLRPLSITGRVSPEGRSAIEQFVFQADAPTPDATPVFRLRRPSNGQEEMTAYQFQR